jgi:hypothetical protein
MMSAIEEYRALPTFETLEALRQSLYAEGGWLGASLAGIPLFLFAAWKCNGCCTSTRLAMVAVALLGMPAVACWKAVRLSLGQEVMGEAELKARLLFYELRAALQDPDCDIVKWIALHRAEFAPNAPNPSLFWATNCVVIGDRYRLNDVPPELVADCLVAANNRKIGLNIRDSSIGNRSGTKESGHRALSRLLYCQKVFAARGKAAFDDRSFLSQLAGLAVVRQICATEAILSKVLGVAAGDRFSYLQDNGVHLDLKKRIVVVLGDDTTQPYLDDFLHIVGQHAAVRVVCTDEVLNAFSAGDFLSTLELPCAISLYTKEAGLWGERRPISSANVEEIGGQ